MVGSVDCLSAAFPTPMLIGRVPVYSKSPGKGPSSRHKGEENPESHHPAYLWI